MSASRFFFGLPCGRIDISFQFYTFLPFSLPSLDVNGRTSFIDVPLCDLFYSAVLLIHRLF